MKQKHPILYTLRITIIVLITACSHSAVYAQRVGISSDVLKLVTLSPNIAPEIILSDRLSLNMELTFNPFGHILKNVQLKHIAVTPELRFWFKRPLYSHYIGLNMNFTAYDLHVNSYRAKGYVGSIGIGYGYSFLLSQHWSIVPHIGAGIGVRRNRGEGNVPTKSSIVPTLTQVGISLSYIIK